MLKTALLLIWLVAHVETSFPDTSVYSFRPGGDVALSIPVGDADVQSNESDGLRITYRVLGEASPRSTVRVHKDIHGTPADFRFESLPRAQSLRVTLFVPKHTNLRIKIGTGGISLNNVTGNKILYVNRGDVAIHSELSDYKQVSAKCNFGTITAPNLPKEKAFRGSMLSVRGNGRYSLHVGVNAGNIIID